MTEIDLNISSKDNFLNKLGNSIDNDKPGIFKFRKQKYFGEFNSETFRLIKNRVRNNYQIFYKINGQITNQNVKIKIELLNRVYITIGIFFTLGLILLSLPYKNEIQGLWLLFPPGLITLIFWSYKFFKRKNIIIRDFEKMTN